MHTLAQIMPEQHLELVGAQQLAVPNHLSEPDVVDQTEFVLEKYLEEFIISNFKQIFKNKHEVYEDDEGNDGQQYTTDIGPIDILATEASSKTFVVIELKKGRTSDQVVGQILRYMGWVKA